MVRVMDTLGWAAVAGLTMAAIWLVTSLPVSGSGWIR